MPAKRRLRAHTNAAKPLNQSSQRPLTHKLTFDRATRRWICKCGYKLGDGHDKLYGQCLFHKAAGHAGPFNPSVVVRRSIEAGRRTYHENKITEKHGKLL